MNDTIDLLQIKIEKARMELPEATRRAIDAVPWKTTILAMKTSKGYTFEQLGDLETETELLLCGLLNPEDYPKELEKRMGITKAQADVLVNEMNELVFKKIREEMMKSPEQKKETEEIVSPQTVKPKIPTMIMPEKPKTETHPILTEKLTGSFQALATKTEHALENLSKTTELPSGTSAPEIPKTTTEIKPNTTPATPKTNPPTPYPPHKDPYRLSPDE